MQRTRFFRRGFPLLLVMLALFISAYSTLWSQPSRGTWYPLRAMETVGMGVADPAGLIYAPESESLFLFDAQAGREAGAFARLNLFGDFLGANALTLAPSDPFNVTYAAQRGGVLFYHARPGAAPEIVEVALDSAGERSPAQQRVRRYDARALGVRLARGLAFDGERNRLYVLDGGGTVPALVTVSGLALDGGREGRPSRVPLEAFESQTLRGLAFNPHNGHLYTLAVEQQTIYGFDEDGAIVDSVALADAGMSDPQGLVFAPSADLTDAPGNVNLYVADGGANAAGPQDSGSTDDSGGQVIEFAYASDVQLLAPPTALQPATLVNIIDTSKAAWSPSSPDPAGIAYRPATGGLVISDSEVEENHPDFQGFNVFESTTGGTLFDNCVTTSFSNEPTGAAVNPSNGHIFFTDDNANAVFEVGLGPDGVYCTADDTVTELDTTIFNSQDPEGLAFGNNKLFISDGVNTQVYVVDLGADGVIGGTGAGSDALVDDFDTTALGLRDPEGIEFNPINGTLFLVSTIGSDDYLVETTTAGVAINSFDLTSLGSTPRSGLAYGPGSENPAIYTIYMASRGVDNGADPNENDGKVYEISIGDEGPGPTPTPTSTPDPGHTAPVVNAGPDQTITIVGEAFLDGTVSDDGLPDPPGAVTTAWSQVDGPGTVTFANSSAVDTTATFSALGTYTLRLTANDGDLSSADDVMVTVTGSGGELIFELQLSNGNDDAEEDGAGSVSLTSSDLELVDGQVVGIRFNGVALPQGATIVDAYVQFQVDETSSVATALTFQAEDVDNAAPFQALNNNISSRARTAAAVSWEPVPWLTIGAAGPDQRTPNIASLIQEVVNRPGWSSGNALAVIVTGSGVRTAESYNGSPAGAPLLYVAYLTGGAPAAVNDSYVTDEDVTLAVAAPGVLSNDSDPENDPLTAALVDDVNNGVLTLNGDGSFSYTPDANFYGSDTFTYTANDGAADSGIATVTITVNGVNDAPLAVDDSYATDEDMPLSVAAPGVLANDGDVDGDALNAVLVNGVTNGNLTLNADGSFSYTPDAGFNGGDSFTYTANDGNAASNVATVTITVNAVNAAPAAVDDNYATDEDTTLSVAAPGVLANDSDADGDGLSVVLVDDVTNGTLTLNGDGAFTYTPDANFNGSDAFTYRANDGAADSNTATVIIVVNPVNDPPAAGNDSYATTENTTLNVAAPGVLTNDSDVDGDPLSAVLLSSVANGTLNLNGDGSFSYTPNAGFDGSDSFTYSATDGADSSNAAMVTITVGPVNDPPTAVDDGYATDEDSTLTVAAPGVLSNDGDPENDTLTAVLIGDVSNGVLMLNADGSLVYTPNANFNGSDAFTYAANDGTNNSNAATVTITVNAVNDAPVALDDAYITDEDAILTVAAPGVLANDGDADGDALSAVLVSDVAHGALTLNGDGSFSYAPNTDFNGSDAFTYTANDGTSDAIAVSVTISVNAVNDPPAAVGDSYVIDEDTTLSVAAPGVLANDDDVDGDALSALLVGDVANGVLTLNADGSFVYTPDADFNGSDTFTYAASDGAANSNTATVTITVTGVNDAPVAVDDSYATNEETALTVSAPGVLANDSDVDGDALSAALMSDVANGALTLNGDGSFIYTPNAGFDGNDSFTYRAGDGNADSNVATVTITVNATSVTIDAVAGSESPVAGTVSGNYTDTHLNDGLTESITERESGGAPSSRYSYLEHKWIFNVAPGNVVTFHANAWSSGSTDGDAFVFAYSTNDTNYVAMFAVTGTSDDAPQSYVLPPSVEGTVYIRVTDSDRFNGNRALDTIYVDHLYIRSESEAANPPAAPTELDAQALSVSQIALTWSDNAVDEDGFYIERAENNGPWLLIDTVGTDVVAYTDDAVFPSTTYTYRVRAYNASGSSGYSNTATVTTPEGLNLSGTGYKVQGVHTVDLSWSGNVTAVDIYRDGQLIASGITGNNYTDSTGVKGNGSYQYQVCEAGNPVNCSNIIDIIF